MTMDAASLSQRLQGLPGLAMTLAEDDTRKFQISASGQLSIFRGNRWSSSKTALDAQAVGSLAAEIARRPTEALLGPWFLRVLAGGTGLTIFGERCPRVGQEALPDEVEEELLAQARAGSTGVIAGGLGSNTASMLLRIASLLGRRELVFVSDLPPGEPVAPTLTHVFPPSNARQRRDLERLLRAHDCIFWEGIRRRDDLASLASAPNAHNRWFSVDAAGPEALARTLDGLASPLGTLRVDSCIFIDVTADQGATIASLARHGGDGWVELLDDAPAVIDALEELEVLEAGRADDGSTRAYQPPSQAPEEEAAFVPPTGETPSQAAIVHRKRPGRRSGAASSHDAPDAPPDEPTVDSTIEPLALDEDSDPTLSSGMQRPRKLAGMSLDELLQSDEIEREELLRHSGEIDLQSMIEARKERRRQQADRDAALSEASAPSADQPPAAGLEQHSDVAATNVADGAQVDAILERMSGDGGAAASDLFADIDPDELSPPVREETTALTPVDMGRIRESAADDISWLIEEELGDEDDDTLREASSPVEKDDGTNPAKPVWDADPAPTNEIAREPAAHREASEPES